MRIPNSLAPDFHANPNTGARLPTLDFHTNSNTGARLELLQTGNTTASALEEGAAGQGSRRLFMMRREECSSEPEDQSSGGEEDRLADPEDVWQSVLEELQIEEEYGEEDLVWSESEAAQECLEAAGREMADGEAVCKDPVFGVSCALAEAFEEYDKLSRLERLEEFAKMVKGHWESARMVLQQPEDY